MPSIWDPRYTPPKNYLGLTTLSYSLYDLYFSSIEIAANPPEILPAILLVELNVPLTVF